ncbi:MAG: TIGR00300 family protein [Candidatus Odinarchaeota archaeon]
MGEPRRVDVEKYPFDTIVNLQGHLLDSNIFSQVLGTIYDLDGEIEIIDLKVGRTKEDISYASIRVFAKSNDELQHILDVIQKFGARSPDFEDAELSPAPADNVFPDGFYSTTHHKTYVRYKGEWLEVKNIEMDKGIMIKDGAAYCVPLSKVKKGELFVIGTKGIRVKPPERPRKRGVFEFMTSSVSSERPVKVYAEAIGEEMLNVKRKGGKIVFVAGPAVIHSGGRECLAELIKMGYVNALLAGNALAVHDLEAGIFGTSLGVNLKTTQPMEGGHRHHLVTINEIRKAGSIKRAVEKGLVKDGVMYELINKGVPFVLAGSIRDDGPLPEVITNTIEAQDKMRETLRDVDLVVMLATTLHSIAVGNMLPSWVKTICVDVNPAVVAKLMDRGTQQAIGVVSDVGAFLPLLVQALKK